MSKNNDPSKFDISKIIIEHIRTLKDYESGKYKRSDFFYSFVIPLVIAIILTVLNHPLTSNNVGVIVTAFSVFAAFLLNILVVLFTMVERARENVTNEYNKELRKAIVKQTYHNISFALLLSIFIVVLMVLIILLPSIPIVIACIAAIGDFLIFVFITTILMILKRINSLISKELD